MVAPQESLQGENAAPQRLGNARYVLRLLRVGGHILVCLGVLISLPLLSDARLQRIQRWWYARLLRILGVRIHTHGTPPAAGALVVANHVSWLDILILGSLFYPAFVSKAEIGGWPIIGRFAQRSGTVFLPRGAFRTDEATRRLRASLDARRSVLLFPEATTRADLAPSRFHARLFAAAIDGGHPVAPVAIHYRPENGTTAGHHPLAPWVDEASLGSHFARLLRLPRLDVDVTCCASIASTGRQRRELADASNAAIANALGGASANAG